MLKRIFSLSFVIFILSVAIGSFSVSAERFNINIVHTSDMGGTIFKNEEKGTIGYGNVLSVRENIGDPIVIDAGNFLADTSQKSTGLNDKIIYAMNKAGYKYATLGGKDLRYTKEEIDTILLGADFDIVSSNLMKEGEYLFEPTETKIVNGVKVGIFAITDTQSTAEIQVEDPEAAAGKIVKQLKAGGSKIIIGIVNTENHELTKKIAEQNTGITMLIESGTNNFLPKGEPVGNTLIVNSGSLGNAVGVSAVTMDNNTLMSFQTSNYNLGNIKSVYPDTNRLEEEMGSAQDEIDSLNNDVLCTVSEKLSYSEKELQTKSTPLGNFVADAIMNMTEADVAIIRGSVISGGISKAITGKETNELLKDNYDIEIRKITGGNLIKVMEIALNKIQTDGEGNIDTDASVSDKFLQIAGFKVQYNPTKNAGSRVIKLITDDGKKVGDFSNKLFTIAAPSEIFTAYSEYLTAAETVDVQENFILYFRDYLTECKSIEADMEERIQTTDAKKSYMWIVWIVVGSFLAAGILSYAVAQIIIMISKRS